VYYNIKIKSKGSEFILESADKSVTQREMDLYFAGIFDVSEEFKANIKKVVVVNENLKSINEVEKVNNEPKKPNEFVSKPAEEEKIETVKFVSEQNDKPDVLELFYKTPLQEEVKEPEIQTEPVVEKDNSQFNFRQNEIIPKEEVEVAEESSKLENTVKQVEELCEQESIEEVKEEPVKEHTKEPLYSFDDNVNDYFKAVEQEAKKEEVQLSYVLQLNDDIPQGDNFLLEMPKNKNEIDDLIDRAQEKMDLTDDGIDINSIISPSSKKEQNIEKIETENTISAIKNDIHNDENQIKVDAIFGNNLNQVENTMQSNNNTQVLDFKPFLAGYNCKNLQDEFIVCAYFIKHTLKQQSFTIKFINSKLFQATSRIANMSIVDEMVMKEYIGVVDYETPKTYSITAQGEIYFTSLQG